MMRYIGVKTALSNDQGSTIGGKASNLFKLQELGLNVPKFLVIPSEVLQNFVSDDLLIASQDEILNCINEISIPQEFIDGMLSQFQGVKYFAVRSSALDEDSKSLSYAGQFESYLFVTPVQVAAHIKLVWRSAFSRRIIDYRKQNQVTSEMGIAVIVQEMLDSEISGVAFGLNPVNGNRHQKVINSVYGLGEGLVSGQLNSDHFTVEADIVSSEIAVKEEKFVLDDNSKGGTVCVAVDLVDQSSASLSDKQVLEISSLLDRLAIHFNGPQDIEFAYRDGTLYLLQTRPITATFSAFEDRGNYILWDNSNIIESYPGITKPLTFSFISQSYENAYKLFCAFMGVSAKSISANQRVFINTLGLIRGRVYYNLKTWYHMLALLPGYSINARFMEKMMGVKERFDLPQSYRLSKAQAWWSILKMGVQMYRRFLSLPRRRKEFMILLDSTIDKYKKIDFDEKDSKELMDLYLQFEFTLLNEWKAPLLNDFFAMIWFGLLQKNCEKLEIKGNPNIHNDLLCGSEDIISVQPIHRCIAIASLVDQDVTLRQQFVEWDEQRIWRELKENTSAKYQELRGEIDRYLTDFGERCIGELKLETVSYVQDPSKLIRIIKSYVINGLTATRLSDKVEHNVREQAEALVAEKLKGNFFKQWKFKKTLNRARELVSARENLRYERTRAFGVVRQIFVHMGREFSTLKVIDDPRDIFFLSKEEIFAFIEGRSINVNLKTLVDLRKNEYLQFEQESPPAERFATYGPVYVFNDFYDRSKANLLDGDLKGIGCCPGIVRAKVRVVRDPESISSLEGDILVTSSTDPGWVTLFPSASGIIVERGSLLSHSAIVSREMGIPCIVGVTGLLATLNTGDEIEMDGSTGMIKIMHTA
ncbi:MAG: PEP/pyruvate-binding domain-containing protein [Saprospiraceae bacterium]